MSTSESDIFDTLIIGSGFGGSMVAQTLVHAGERVLMLERGPWVARGPENWIPETWGELSPCYSRDTPYQAVVGGRRRIVGGHYCVGGPSVIYAGVSLRYREEDFDPGPEIVGDSGAQWPCTYDDLESYYARAERLLGVAGSDQADPTAPWRSAPYPHLPGPLSHPARLIESAARSLGLKPFRLPLAINYRQDMGRACVACTTCDGFACAIGAKNDLAVQVLPQLIQKGLALKPNTVAVRLIHQGAVVVRVECVDTHTSQAITYRARRFVLSAGALASPHLLLASGLQHLNSAGDAVGCYLLRHYRSVVYGWFPRDPNPAQEFHKQVGIHDYYFGHPTVRTPGGKLGGIQSIAIPPASLGAYLPKGLRPVALRLLGHCTGLMVTTEDQPQYQNRVFLDLATADCWGRPGLVIEHRYSKRDLAAARALAGKAAQILRRAGAVLCFEFPIRTMTHAAGTVRMGLDPCKSPLDPYCRFRGVDNLYVVDGSCLPTSAGVNPSLTIAANALQAAALMIENP